MFLLELFFFLKGKKKECKNVTATVLVVEVIKTAPNQRIYGTFRLGDKRGLVGKGPKLPPEVISQVCGCVSERENVRVLV